MIYSLLDTVPVLTERTDYGYVCTNPSGLVVFDTPERVVAQAAADLGWTVMIVPRRENAIKT